jgi:hypothetical protein
VLAAYAFLIPVMLVLFLPFSLFAALRQPGLLRLLYTLTREPLFEVALFLTVASIALSILRYRLWDIDLIIRRTLLYSTLTGALALFYFISVFVLQRLLSIWTSEPRTPLVTVLSTLGVVILFSPLRGRLQHGLDRRFYRRWYDSERVMASFSTVVRDEVMLHSLTTHLLHVVEETWQPTAVSLWLCNQKIDCFVPPEEETPTRLVVENDANLSTHHPSL